MVNHFIYHNRFIWVGDAPTKDPQVHQKRRAANPAGWRVRRVCQRINSAISTSLIAFAGRVQKFEPVPGADPTKIAGQILRTWGTWKK